MTNYKHWCNNLHFSRKILSQICHYYLLPRKLQ